MTAPCRLHTLADCPGTGAACLVGRPSCPGPVDLDAPRERGDQRKRTATGQRGKIAPLGTCDCGQEGKLYRSALYVGLRCAKCYKRVQNAARRLTHGC